MSERAPRQRRTLRIDQISVEGPAISRAALSDAIQAELTRALSAPGALAALKAAGYAPRVDGGTIRPAKPGASALGSAIAQATLGALQR